MDVKTGYRGYETHIQTDGVTAPRVIYETLYFVGAKEKCTYTHTSQQQG
jgi:hypothetical protein